MTYESRYQRLLERFRDHFGIDLSRTSLEVEQVSRQLERIARINAADAKQLLADAVSSKEGLMRVASIVSVGETYFYRYREQIEFLVKHVMSTSSGYGKAVQPVWCAGCSTGEEAHSIAIAIHRLFGDIPPLQLAIWGSDLNLEAIDSARLGIYGRWSFRDVPDWLPSLYFTPTSDNRYQLKSEFLKRTRFIHESIQERLLQTPDMQFSAVLFRNVSIYMTDEAIQETINEVVRVLVPGGLLVIAPTDPPSVHPLLRRHPEGIPGVWLRMSTANSPTTSIQPFLFDSINDLPVTEALADGTNDSTSADVLKPEVNFLAAQAAVHNFIVNGKIRDGIDFLSERLQDEGPKELLFYLRGKLQFESGNFVAAGADFEQAVLLQPNEELFQFWYVLSLLENGEAERAKQHGAVLTSCLKAMDESHVFMDGVTSVKQLLLSLHVLLEDES